MTDIIDFAKELAAMKRRVARLEKGAGIMNSTIKTLTTVVNHADAAAKEAKTAALEAAENSAQVIAILSAAKGFAGFAAKHGPRIVAALVGALAYKGLIDEKMGSFITGIFVS